MARGRAVGRWLAGTATAGVLVVAAALLLSGGTAVAVPRQASRQPPRQRVEVHSAGAAAVTMLPLSAPLEDGASSILNGNERVRTVQPVFGGSFGLARDELDDYSDAWEDAVAAEEEDAATDEGIVADGEEVPLLDEAEASEPTEDLDPLPPSPAAAAGGDALPPPPTRAVAAQAGAPPLSTTGATASDASAPVTQAGAPGVQSVVMATESSEAALDALALAATPEAGAAAPTAAVVSPTGATAAEVAAPEAVAAASEASAPLPVAPAAAPVAPVTAPLAPAAAPAGAAVLEGGAPEAVVAASPAAADVASWNDAPAVSSAVAVVTASPEEAPVASRPISRAAASRPGSTISAVAVPPLGAMAVTARPPRAVNERTATDSSSMVRLGEPLVAPTVGASKGSVASKLLLLHRMSLERDAQAKVDHELLPPAEVAIAPDAGTVVDARRRPPIHGDLSDSLAPPNPTADTAALVSDDAAGVTKNATDTAGVGEHAPAAAVKRTRAVLAAAATVNSTRPTREAMPVVMKNAIPLSPDAKADILVMDGEAILAATTTPPDAAGPATSPARATAAVTHSPRPPSVRGGPSTAAAADPADAVAASNAVDEVTVSATATVAAADGAPARADVEKPGAVAATVATPSPATAPTSSRQSDRPVAAPAEPVGASEKADAMGDAALAVAPDVADWVGPLPSPLVTPSASPTQLDDSDAAAATPEYVPATTVSREVPRDAAVEAANASSAAVGAPPPAPTAPVQQPPPESARSFTQMASRAVAAAIEAAVMEAAATARATAAVGARTSEATPPPCSLTPSPGGHERAGSHAVVPSPSGKVRTAKSGPPPDDPSTVPRAQPTRGGERHHDRPVRRLPPPTPPSVAGAADREPDLPPAGASAALASAPTPPGSRGVYIFGGDGSVWYSSAGRLAHVGGDVALGATATTGTAVVEEVMAAAGAPRKGAALHGTAGSAGVTALLPKRMMSPGGMLARVLPATGMRYPPEPSAKPPGLPPRPAYTLPSPLLPDMPTAVRWHRPAAPSAAAVPAVDTNPVPAADTDPSLVANRLVMPWAVRPAKPGALVVDAAPAGGATEGQRPAPPGPASATPPPTPPLHPVEGTSPFVPVVHAGGACHYNRTSCSCARSVAGAPSSGSPPTCIRYAALDASAGAPPRCTAEPCERPAPRFVCDCMGAATCDVRRTVVDRWHRIGGGAGEAAAAEGEPFRCELQERLITVVSCVDRCG